MRFYSGGRHTHPTTTVWQILQHTAGQYGFKHYQVVMVGEDGQNIQYAFVQRASEKDEPGEVMATVNAVLIGNGRFSLDIIVNDGHEFSKFEEKVKEGIVLNDAGRDVSGPSVHSRGIANSYFLY